MSFRLFCSLVLLAGGLAVSALRAQTPTPQLAPEPQVFDFYARGPYRGGLPRPAELLGYSPGEFYANYGAIEKVLHAYAAKSDRMKLMEIGRTNEFRTMYLLAISSPKNLARLDAIQAANRRLADPRASLDAGELNALLKTQPIIVWLSYNIHGDEAAGTEAAMQVLHQLLDSDDPALRAALDNVVVLMNPCQNPDGRERFVTWANAHGIGRPETFAYEKTNPWNVQGRFNHYYFDLNRDMLVSSQVESRAAMKAFLAWKPQVSADHHGETKEYFFPPAALPINTNLARPEFEKWLDRFGRGNAAAFDRHGWLYYVRDVFDVFYPGYWDSWPSLHGATGMTYETSGGGKLGRNHRRDDETVQTLRDAIAKHVTASFATIETAAANRVERLRAFRQHFVDALAAGGQGDVRQFIVPPARDPWRAGELVSILLRNGIEVRQATAAFTVKASRDYLGGPPQERTFLAGSYVIDLAQPHGRVAKALLEIETPQDKEFIARQEEKRARNELRGENVAKEDYEFYDITAWALPLTFGVEAYWTAEPAAVAGELISAPAAPALPPLPKANTAYVFAPDTEGALRLALQLLGEGYRLATAVRPLDAGGKNFIRGALIARVVRNPASLHTRIAALAQEHGVVVHAIDSAFADAGITGVGSESVVTLKAPKVAVLAGKPVTPSSYGALCFLFEKDYAVDYVPVAVEALTSMRLADFNVIVLPNGSADGYADRLGESVVARLKTWVEDGGTLICIGGAAEWAAGEHVKFTQAKLVGRDKKKDELEDVDEEDEEPAEEAEVIPEETDPAATEAGTASANGDGATETERKRVLEQSGPNVANGVNGEKGAKKTKKPREPLPVPGAIFKAKVNHDHFITFGYEADVLPVLVNTDVFFKKTKTGTNVLTFEGDKLHLTGFIWKNNTVELLRKTAAVIDEPLGGGHVVLFTDEPGYRQIWHATTRLLINSLLFGPALQGEFNSYYAHE